MKLRRLPAIGLGLVLAAVTPGSYGSVAGLAAQQPHWLGFRGDLGAEVPNGDAADLFQGNVRGEFSLLFQPRPFLPFYFGFGFGWTTFHLEPPYTDVCIDATTQNLERCEPWNSVGAHLFVGAYLGRWLTLPLYLEARLIERRLRPMDYRSFDVNADDYIEDLPHPECTGVGVEGLIGLQLPLTRRATRVDVGARIGQFRPVNVVFDSVCGSILDATFSNLPPIHGGWTLGIQVGLVWFP